MVYLGTPSDDDFEYYRDVGFIVPQFPVSEPGDDYLGNGFYSDPPNYARCLPETRATYLDWLVERNSTRYSVKFAILYFTGLERRFFFDHSTRAEKISIVEEAERLWEIYRDDSYADNLLQTFFSIGKLILGLDQDVQPTKSRYRHPSYTAVLSAIGIMANDKKPLNGRWLFNWYVINSRFNATIHRVFPEFRALFISMFDERHPKGMLLPIPEDDAFVGYRSQAFQYTVDLIRYIGYVGTLSDESDSVLFSVADDIAEEAEISLNKFGRYLGKHPERRAQLAAHLLLPARIRDQFPCQEAQRISSWVQNRLQRGGVIRFAEVVEIAEGEAVERITKAKTIKIIDKFADLQIRITPDPRLTNYSLKLEDQVIIFRYGGEYQSFEQPGEEYWNTFRHLAIACFVIFSTNRRAISEHVVLNRLFSEKNLTLAEQHNLIAHFTWMNIVKPTLQMLRQNLKTLPQSAKQELAPVALSAAVFEGYVPPQRVDAVKKIYKLLDLDVSAVYGDLHSHSIGDEPVAVRSDSGTQQIFEIPAAGEKPTSFSLDSERIDSVLDSTDRVSAVLGEIFADDSQTPEHDQHDSVDELFLGMDNRHTSLIQELIKRSHWNDEEFKQLAGQFKLMPGGALEMLNEWAFDKFDEPLLEEYDGYNLNQNVVEQLEML